MSDKSGKVVVKNDSSPKNKKPFCELDGCQAFKYLGELHIKVLEDLSLNLEDGCSYTEWYDTLVELVDIEIIEL